MTWINDAQKDRPNDAKREKLLAKRADLVKQVEKLSMEPVGKSQAAALGRQEDLLELARKIKNIDKQLGRVFA